MRFVPAKFLEEGMVLARSLYDNLHNVLLSKGHILTLSNIKRIVELGYQGLYIKSDEYQLDFDSINDIITNDIRQRAKLIIKRTFITDDNTVKSEQYGQDISNIVFSIIDQLISNDKLVVNLLDLKTYDNYTFEHSVNITILAVVTGIKYGLYGSELYELGFGAIMHDIGKKYIDIDILNKKAKLNDEEMEQVKEHPKFGAKFLRDMFKVNEPIVQCALQHHERFDGGGYPYGLKGEEISLNGRIIAICDVYDALTSNRVYREAIHPHEAIQYILAQSGTHFDNNLVDIFVAHVTPYPIGTIVQLSNGCLGVVIEIKPNLCSRPKVRVIKDANQNNAKIYDLDLSQEENIHILIKEVKQHIK